MEVGTWGGVIDEKLLRELSDKGFKIDANGVITAISATGAGLLGALGIGASNNSYASEDYKSLSGI
jgi:hypothetical protein